jgi:hypothetical protein
MSVDGGIFADTFDEFMRNLLENLIAEQVFRVGVIGGCPECFFSSLFSANGFSDNL